MEELLAGLNSFAPLINLSILVAGACWVYMTADTRTKLERMESDAVRGRSAIFDRLDAVVAHLARLNGRTAVIEERVTKIEDQCDERHEKLADEVKTIHRRCFEVLANSKHGKAEA